jgi:hypothetical protein
MLHLTSCVTVNNERQAFAAGALASAAGKDRLPPRRLTASNVAAASWCAGFDAERGHQAVQAHTSGFAAQFGAEAA